MTTDALPREGATKTAMLDFVRAVTEPGEAFVSPDERIATFDNDRTLWCQRPMYPQADFLVRRWAEQVKADPSLAAQQPWKAGAAADHVPELIRGVTEATDGITTVAFEAAVRRFFDTAQHPTLGVPYTQIAFRPMRKLIKLLEAQDFTVCVCSAGGRDFVRVVSEEMYGIPRERVIGSGTTLEYRQGDVYRTQGVEQPIDDGVPESLCTSGPAPAESRCSVVATPTETPPCWSRSSRCWSATTTSRATKRAGSVPAAPGSSPTARALREHRLKPVN